MSSRLPRGCTWGLSPPEAPAHTWTLAHCRCAWVTGLELDTYAETLTAASGQGLWQWSEPAWEALDLDEAPGPIDAYDAYDASYTDTWIAVDDRIYSWTENPGVWARWGEQGWVQTDLPAARSPYSPRPAHS